MPGLFIEPDGICLYVTEKCNSNCVMCPMSADVRRRGTAMSKEEWLHAVDELPEEVSHITVTGGEPFLEYQYLIPVLKKINERFPETEVLILTNGRALSLGKVFDELRDVITENDCFAIPIHGSTPELHDQITQSPGSFRQTMQGIRNLSTACAKVEIRIVGHQKNIHDIPNIYEMLTQSDLGVNVIHLIAMEMTGSAAAARKDLWVDYRKLCLAAEGGIRTALKHGIDVGLYNFPLCCIPERLWGIARKSISPDKVRYYEECDLCRVKEACGGLFYSTYGLNLCKVSPR